MSADYVISPPPQATIAVAGSSKVFPVRRIWCVGRNYIEHIREMGQDERLPPFYFAKPADAIVPVIQGFGADHLGILYSFVVPVPCYLYIVFYGLRGHKPAAA